MDMGSENASLLTEAVSKDDQETNTKTDEKTTIAVLSAVLAAVVVVNVVFIIWVWRRRWTLPCAGKGWQFYASFLVKYVASHF